MIRDVAIAETKYDSTQPVLHQTDKGQNGQCKQMS